MAMERRLKTFQQNWLYDLLVLLNASEEKRTELLENQIARAESGMTVEEIAHVKERVARVSKK